MPGENDEKRMGDYTLAELNQMTTGEYANASAHGFHKPVKSPGAALVVELPEQITLPSAVPQPVSTPEPDPNAWANAKSRQGKDFTCPSGQTCRLKPLDPERLLQAGILDKVTRLEGLADVLIQAAEGQPPTMAKIPSREELWMLLKTINELIPLAVEQPTVWAIPDIDDPVVENRIRQADRIYVDDIDLDDRVAILEEALKGLRLLDRFRNPG
jgi:hypothetical protein